MFLLTMQEVQPIKPETKDPLKEGIDHPDGPSLEEMVYGAEEANKYPNQNEKDADIRKAGLDKPDV